VRVFFTAEAEDGLERIGDHIAKESPVRALSFVRELRAKALDLANYPEAFPLVRRFEASYQASEKLTRVEGFPCRRGRESMGPH
jgi:plasmid stabilization system protein ParE